MIEQITNETTLSASTIEESKLPQVRKFLIQLASSLTGDPKYFSKFEEIFKEQLRIADAESSFMQTIKEERNKQKSTEENKSQAEEKPLANISPEEFMNAFNNVFGSHVKNDSFLSDHQWGIDNSGRMTLTVEPFKLSSELMIYLDVDDSSPQANYQVRKVIASMDIFSKNFLSHIEKRLTDEERRNSHCFYFPNEQIIQEMIADIRNIIVEKAASNVSNALLEQSVSESLSFMPNDVINLVGQMTGYTRSKKQEPESKQQLETKQSSTTNIIENLNITADEMKNAQTEAKSKTTSKNDMPIEDTSKSQKDTDVTIGNKSDFRPCL